MHTIYRPQKVEQMMVMTMTMMTMTMRVMVMMVMSNSPKIASKYKKGDGG